MKLTRAVTHIRLSDANAIKLRQLDALAAEYMRLCQQYTTAFCTEVEPNKYADAWLFSSFSARWQRVVIQHAAGVAQSWRTNRNRAFQAYLDDLADYQAQDAPQRPAPTWRDWQTPTLKQTVIQANANVVALEPSEDSTFDYWLRISTLSKGTPIRLPVKLAPYHRRIAAILCPVPIALISRRSAAKRVISSSMPTKTQRSITRLASVTARCGHIAAKRPSKRCLMPGISPLSNHRIVVVDPPAENLPCMVSLSNHRGARA